MKAAYFSGMTALAVIAAAPAFGQDHVAPVTEYVNANVSPWMSDPVILAALKERNTVNAGRSQADIDALDAQWRAEVDSGSKPLIDEVMNSALSKWLSAKQEEAGGMLTEVFVMDNKGLNVGQSEVTSDYWQGDEAKWQNSFGKGAGAVFVDEVEKDESTQVLQTQASMAIVDPATSEVVGAITVGIDVSGL